MKSRIVFWMSLFTFSWAAWGADFPQKLESVTVDEVAQVEAQNVVENLKKCLVDHGRRTGADPKFISEKLLNSIDTSRDACYLVNYRKSTLIRILKEQEKQRALPKSFEPWLIDDTKSALADAVVDGYVEFKEGVTLDFYGAIIKARQQKADKAYGKIDLQNLISLWNEVGSANLDKGFFNPVQLDPESLSTNAIFEQMRAANYWVGHLALERSGSGAIQKFWDSPEGPDGDPLFASVLEAIEQSQMDVAKTFYFGGGGNGQFPWSRNLLILIDKDGVMIGFEMGYSE